MSFAADSPAVSRIVPSPNFGERRLPDAPSMLILHYTGMRDGYVAMRRLSESDSEVSCHYLVHEDGEVIQMVPEALRAWHAGKGSWRGKDDINSRSIGIEIANPGHEWGYHLFPDAQMDAVVRLCTDIVRRHAISPALVLAHSDIAPDRKEDPGELFDWRRLHDNGVGLWTPPRPLIGGRALKPGSEGRAVAQMQRLLTEYGYGVEVTGRFDAATTSVVTAFQRHFRPGRVDGVADRSTMATLRDLVGLAGSGQELESMR